MKYFILKKLDAADSEKVLNIVDRIRSIAKIVSWTETDTTAAELIIAVGGDGTVMHGMKLSAQKNIPCIGVNIGNLGFLAEFNPAQLEAEFLKYIENPIRGDVRTLIEESHSATRVINEFYISPVLSRDTLSYEFFIDGISSGTHRANGLLISTPTGSTAYSLSVGGSIIQPNAPVFQITPVAPMSLNSRSVIVSNSSNICVRVKIKSGVAYSLIGDGQAIYEVTEYDAINNCYTFSFKKAEKLAVLDHNASWNFFEILKEKLKWNTAV